ncbi:uncharacterized protein LOC132747740 [Ruditapes philippinarum]|uniref:uncharacterized protein LOC132747740 n=1 Tax=Ruditapes philippinarum TaxID=129788 RepID=UPI00295B63A5|nr:uncharacterized protein LOC132747740 [Ruditapes philippinarum]
MENLHGNVDIVTTSSDDFTARVCEHCESAGKRAEADGFCVDCSEYMCNCCLLYHAKYKPEHSTKGKDNMPLDVRFEKCLKHHMKQMKYFCTDCNNVACAECITNEGCYHEDGCRNKKWTLLYKVALENNVSKTQFDTKIAETTEKLANIEDTIDTLTTKRKDRIRESIKQHRHNLESKMKELECHFLKKTDEIENTFKPSIDSLSYKVQSMKTMLRSVESQSGNCCSNFIALKNIDKRIAPVEKGLECLKKQTEIMAYKFKANPSRIVDKSDFGNILFAETFLTKTACYKNDIDVNLYKHWIIPTNISDLLIKDDLLVEISYMCSAIVMVDPIKQKVLSQLFMSSPPRSAASINGTRIAVALPHDGKIKLFDIINSEFIDRKEDIEVEKDCWNLAYSRSQCCLYVSYIKPTSKITILNETGKVLRLLDKDCLGNKLFMSPRYIILSLDEESLYVSDAQRDAVIKIHSDGRIGAVFKDEKLILPQGLAIDEYGTVFVAGTKSNNIFQLTSDLTKIGIPIGSKHVYEPLSIAIDKVTKKGCLYVGMRANTEIKTFEIKCIQETML